MAVTNTPIFPQSIKTFLAQITAASTTTLVTVATAGTDGTVIRSISVTSQDASSRIMRFYKTRSGVDYCIGAITIPANSGFNGSLATANAFTFATTGLVGAFDSDGNEIIHLESGDTLRASITTTTTSPLNIIAEGVNF